MKKMMYGVISSMLVAGMTYNAAAQGWTENIRLSGDARFRYQNTDEEGAPSRERWRYRGRIGLAAKVNDEVSANLRLVTNSGDPISDNITMDGGFGDPQARLDRVFFTWKPVEPLSLRFGKMSQPWIAVDDLVFSGDVNPEGIAANATFGSDDVKLMLHGGAFVLVERRADDETMLYSGQAAVRFNFGKKDYVMVGASVYAYDNVEGNSEIGKFDRNSTVTQGEGDDAVRVYAGDYLVVEGFVKAEIDVGIPLTLGAQYAVNTDAFSSDDTAYLGMLAVKLPGNFSAGYQYRHVEKDAIFGAFAENTDFGWGTDTKGHIPYVSYAISRNFSVKAQYAMGQKGISSGKDIDTFKIDLACRF